MTAVVGARNLFKFDAGVVHALMQARYQNSSRGQFISEDPVFLGDPKQQVLTDPQSLNSYSYANDNPITKSDPTGRQSTSDYVKQAAMQADMRVAAQIKGDIYRGAETRFYQGVDIMGKVGVVGAVGMGLYLAPEPTIGFIGGIAERKTTDAIEGRTSTNGQLAMAGIVGAALPEFTAERGYIQTLGTTGAVTAFGNIAMDGSVEPTDVATSMFGAGVGKYAQITLTTPQTSAFVKAAVSQIADYGAKTASSVLTARTDKHQ